jgi:putative DNA methylase
MTDHPVKRRKKLIEVAIPLEAINAASAREKSIRHGHPSTLHLWWARRPLAAARAVIFCQMVDDPSAVPEEFPTEEAQENERLRLFALISELVTWENTTNEEVLNRAREEIRRSWRRCCSDNADHPEAAELFNPEKLPGFHDPFAGGGALPLEAQRLGLEAYASDLNPVAVLINKAMIEIPPKFAGMPPVNPESRSKKELIQREWKGAEGLAEDVRYYGKLMRDEAEKIVGHLYPKIEITPELINDADNPRPDLSRYQGKELTPIAYIWARTVESPSPAFSGHHTPLMSSFLLSAKKKKEAYVEPIITREEFRFLVKKGIPTDYSKSKMGTSAGKWNGFKCLLSGAPIPFSYIREEGVAGRLSQKLVAIVLEGDRERVYVPGNLEIEEFITTTASPTWSPELEINHHPRDIKTQIYGLTKYGDLFTARQLNSLNTLCDLVQIARQASFEDASLVVEQDDPGESLEDGGSGIAAYADAISIYLSFQIDQLCNHLSTICAWHVNNEQLKNTFARQALPMVWDFAEVNPFSSSTGSLGNLQDRQVKGILSLGANVSGFSSQQDAATQELSMQRVVSTDPPYYDNIGYADLSDYFYVWLRRSLRRFMPKTLATLAVPKAQELVATPYRHGTKEKADSFFLDGMSGTFRRLGDQILDAFPLTIYYAYKQIEEKEKGGVSSTGWETFLESVIASGFVIQGTWPLRTEQTGAIKVGMNVLASSIVLVCRKRSKEAPFMTRAEFRRQLMETIRGSVKDMEKSNIAPVDMAQAAIGPGISVFSSAKSVLNPDDSRMAVREALVEINAVLDECLSRDEGDLDPDSRFALTFFESFGYTERDFGDAEGLAKARNVSVEGVSKSGILRSVAGKAWLLSREQLDDAWDPIRDDRLCVWEATQHLIKRLEAGGEGSAADLLGQLKKIGGHGDLAANCRALAYRLYNHCEKTKQAEEARAYNGLVIAWPELERLAASQSTETAVQASLI